MRKFKVHVNGVAYTVEVEEEGVSIAPVTPAAQTVKPAAPAPVPSSQPAAAQQAAAGDTAVEAPMPGKITKILVQEGAKVKQGETLLMLEAMKMQNEIQAPCDGTLKALCVKTGDSVKPGQTLALLA